MQALIFGKFLPFHKGHQAMMEYALERCEVLHVLVCKSDKEQITGVKRKQWIEQTFSNIPNVNVKVKVFEYSENDLPNTSESSRVVSKVWANAFKALYPNVDFIVTSEPYGDFVAEYMDIKHILFDMQRLTVSISATKIRSNIYENWNFLPDVVKLDYILKVVIVGTESTGKTTLTKRLGDFFKMPIVLEAGRDIVEDSNDFTFEDLYKIIEEHTRRIQKAIDQLQPMIFIDTDWHITQSYAQYFFGKTLEIHDIYKAIHQADLYLYSKNDAPYVQDGTRLDEVERNRLDVSHKKVLIENGVKFFELSGSWEERFEQAKKLVSSKKKAYPF